MVSYRIKQQDLDNFVKELRKLGHIIADPNMQLYRAKKYRDYTIDLVRKGMLDLKPLTELTQIISEDPHNPLWLEGNLLESMGVKPVGKNAAEAGYWETESGKVPGKKISYAHLARIMHTGYRIPLKGDKGRRVRAWFYAKHGVTFPMNKEWLVVPPRPFMFISYFDYMLNGKDTEAVNEFLDKLEKSPIDTTRTRRVTT